MKKVHTLYRRLSSLLFALLLATVLSYSIPSSAKAAGQLLFKKTKAVKILDARSHELIKTMQTATGLPFVKKGSTGGNTFFSAPDLVGGQVKQYIKGLDANRASMKYKKQVNDAFGGDHVKVIGRESKIAAQTEWVQQTQVAMLAKRNGEKGYNLYIPTERALAEKRRFTKLDEAMTAWKGWFSEKLGIKIQ